MDRDVEYARFQSELLGNLNTTIILAFVLAFTFRRSYKSTTPTINLIKGRLRTFGAWMLKFSVLFSFVFSACITALSSRYSIRRHVVELTRSFDGSLVASFRSHSIDIAAVMIYALKISEILLISSVFFLIALFVPQPSDGADALPQAAGSSIATFSTMWAICRIPVYLYLDAYRTLFDQKLAIFVFELAPSVEFLTAALFTLVANSSRTGRSSENMSLLGVLLLLYAIFKHVVNLVEMPFALTEIHLQALASIQLCLQLGLYLVLLAMFCPLRKAEGAQAAPEALRHDECNSDIALIPSVVEFDERPFRN